MDVRTTGLGPWTAWIAGIALSWAAFGMVAAGLWWFLYWPFVLGAAMLYSILEDRGGQTSTPLTSGVRAFPPRAPVEGAEPRGA
jgi:hypothetical protein